VATYLIGYVNDIFLSNLAIGFYMRTRCSYKNREKANTYRLG